MIPRAVERDVEMLHQEGKRIVVCRFRSDRSPQLQQSAQADTESACRLGAIPPMDIFGE